MCTFEWSSMMRLLLRLLAQIGWIAHFHRPYYLLLRAQLDTHDTPKYSRTDNVVKYALLWAFMAALLACVNMNRKVVYRSSCFVNKFLVYYAQCPISSSLASYGSLNSYKSDIWVPKEWIFPRNSFKADNDVVMNVRSFTCRLPHHWLSKSSLSCIAFV